MVHWNTPDAGPQSAVASPALLGRELYLAAPIRFGNRYPRQRNYHGHYLFSQTGRHVWFESLLESSRLASIDASRSVVAIASQPMRLDFDDGTHHYPDFLAMHSSSRQVVYDVKPQERLTEKALTQFARTRALCSRVGWGYEVLSELSETEEANLTWLRQFKHYGFHPPARTLERLRDALITPLSVFDAAGELELGSLAAGRSAVFHLLWVRAITTDLSARLTDASLVERATHEQD